MRHLPRGRDGRRDLPVLCPRLPRRVHQPLAAASPALSAVWGGSGPARGGQPRRALAKRRVPVARGAPHHHHTLAATQPTCHPTCQPTCSRCAAPLSHTPAATHPTYQPMCHRVRPSCSRCAARPTHSRLHTPTHVSAHVSAHVPAHVSARVPRNRAASTCQPMRHRGSLSRRGASTSSPCSTCEACSSGATAAARRARWCYAQAYA